MQDVADLSELDLQSVVARIFADYWQSLPKVDLIPMRASFDPAAVKALLPDMVIHDMSRLVEFMSAWLGRPWLRAMDAR